MKVVIFADKSYNYIRPIADGLHQAFLELGCQSVIWYDGIYWLNKLKLRKVFVADIWRTFQNLKYGSKKYINRFWSLLTFYNLKRRKELNECDVIVVVQNCPGTFDANNLKRLDFLRNTYHKPIINYDFHYLPNQAWWGRIKQLARPRGLEQFDWYLPVGLVTEFAIPREIPKIYNCIGMDITKSTVGGGKLMPEQKEFRVLLDFPRPGHEETRKREKQWLDDINVKYVELNGRYTTAEIRKIYRSISVYIVSSRESFGLPIVELQLCGAKILTPHKEWVPAHYLNKSPFENGTGNLGSNFVVYQDETDFKEKLLKLKDEIDYSTNVETFQREYPLYFHIDKTELSQFISKIESGEIHADSHLDYKKYNEYISTTQDYETSDID